MRVLIGIDAYTRPQTPSQPSTSARSCSSTQFSPPAGRSALAWAMGQAFPGAPLAVDCAGGLGRSVARHLLAAGERVADLPAKLSSLSRGRRVLRVEPIWIFQTGLRDVRCMALVCGFEQEPEFWVETSAKPSSP